MNILSKIEDRLSIFFDLYDEARIVDPSNCDILQSSTKKLSTYHCLDLETKCNECISKKAFIHNKSFQKLQLINSRAILMISMPINLMDKVYIVEFFKDVTDTLAITECNSKSNADLFFKDVAEKLTKDSLTGAYNRDFIEKNINSKISSGSSNSVSSIMIDLDHFKRVNDLYGHLIGDSVLKEFSKICLSSIRDSDWFCRYGGEEFLIILNDTKLDGALTVSNRIHSALQAYTFSYNDISFQISCSMGIYASTYDKTSFKEILKYSDENLYIAKNSGRNKIIY